MLYNQSKGFTLIELIAVIVVLGVLAATAVPRFVNLSRSAQVEATRSIMGTFRSATSMAHAQWLVSGRPASITMGGVTVNISNEGWPVGATTNSAGCIEIWNGIMQTSVNIVAFNGTAVDEWSALRFGPACVYINQNGAVFDNTSTPFFSYFSTTGTGAEFNLN